MSALIDNTAATALATAPRSKSSKPATGPKKRDRSPGPKVYKNRRGAGFMIRWRYKDTRTGKTEEIKRKALSTTITGARQEARALEREVLDSLTRDPALPEPAPKLEVPTVAAFLPTFEAMLRAEEKTTSTLKLYRSCWRNHVTPAIGGVRLDNVTAAHMGALLQHCDKVGLAPVTKRSVLAAFHRGLTTARSLGHISTVPDVPRIKIPERPVSAYSPGEVRALVEAGERCSPADLAMLYLGLHGGMRAGEVCAIRGEDLRDNGGQMIVSVCRSTKHGVVKSTKNGKARTLTLTHEASAAMRRHLASLADPQAWLFPSRLPDAARDMPVEPHSYNRAMRRVCKAAGVAYAGTHKSRKTAATALARAGKGAWQIAAFMGHGIEMARVYVDRENAQDPLAADAISAYAARHPSTAAAAPRGRVRAP